MIDETEDWLNGEQTDLHSTPLGCTPGCGELHLHCVDCQATVAVDERHACAYGCSKYDPRCQDCALEHWQVVHERQEANRPSWEQVPR